MNYNAQGKENKLYKNLKVWRLIAEIKGINA